MLDVFNVLLCGGCLHFASSLGTMWLLKRLDELRLYITVVPMKATMSLA